MQPTRGDRDDRYRGRSRHTHHSKLDHGDASIDSGYGSSATALPKLSRHDAPGSYHVETSRHDAKTSNPSRDRHGLDEKNSGHSKHKDSDSDTDYDPRDKYYIDVDDDEYDNMSFRNGERPKDRHASINRGKRRESDASTSSGRSNNDRSRHKSSSARRRTSGSSNGSNTRKRYSSTDSKTTSTQADIRDRWARGSSRQPRSKASAASHSRHESNYRSLSPIPSEWGDSDDAPQSARPRQASSRRSPRDVRNLVSKKGQNASAGWIDPEGETAQSFLQKLTKGVDIKSVGKVGLDAAAVAAIKVAVGTRVPWKQRIPKTIAAGAAAAIMDFVVKKTSFQPKGMVGTIFARQFMEIILANLIINPVSTKVTASDIPPAEKNMM
ncbi:hypothetical protein VP1G_11390 [Cytospora mali]|uniref:Uncharacterized protein n=1 Tax=Cytospora mali TaxID=578113 RepID=A0A194VDH8_CYTMA|nr:hypothetical protein VP1G_11390 [Valsa mali var. pyri (nom. inval.)]